MKYKIVALNENKFSDLIEKLRNFLDKKGTFLDKDFEYLFVLGGDGTLIHYIKKYAFQNKKIIGIKGGTVSFLTELKIEDFSFLSDKNFFTNIELLKVQINSDVYYSFNDFFISGSSFLRLEIFVDENFFRSFRGSGLLFSTKVGSTAQNKSFSGPILFPSTNTWLMNSIGEQATSKFFSLNSSLVFSKHEKLSVKILEKDFILYVDGKRIESKFSENFEIKIELIETNSFFLFPSNAQNYLKKLSKNFLSN